jgi:hypothetical protein
VKTSTTILNAHDRLQVQVLIMLLPKTKDYQVKCITNNYHSKAQAVPLHIELHDWVLSVKTFDT